MMDEISRSIEISTETIISSILIGVIALFGFLSYSLYGVRMEYVAAKDIMESKYNLYEYDNKLIHGYDIIDLVLKNARVYEYRVILNNGRTYILNTDMESIYGKSIWTGNYIKYSILGDSLNDSFISKVIRDSRNDVVKYIEFRET